jgi:hypothetical protein
VTKIGFPSEIRGAKSVHAEWGRLGTDHGEQFVEMRVFLCAHNRKEAAQNAGKPQLLLSLSRLMYLCAFLSAATLWSHFHLTFGPATAGNSHECRGCIPPRPTQIPSIPSFLSTI